MKKPLLALVAAALVLAPVAAALDRTQTQVLLRLAQKVTGLKAREQVRVVVERPAAFQTRRVRMLDRAYPRARQDYDETVYRSLGLATGGKGVLRKNLIAVEKRPGLYDPATRTAYIRAGANVRTAALRELVHALQDQHFDLRRLWRVPGDGDARLAAMAAVEGHASLVSGVLGPHRSSSPDDSKLTRFVELERGFTDDVGRRLAADLRNLGGRSAMLSALKRFPDTSEQVFHLDKYLERERAAAIVLPVDAAGMTLAGDGTFGELDVRALLAVFAVPRLDRVGTGWGGGRSALYLGAAGDTVLVALDWDTDRDAAEWAEAVLTYVDKAFDAVAPGLPEPVPCAATSCWNLAGHAVAFERVGSRTTLVLGTDIDASAQLARSLLSVTQPRVDG
jgi:hypothetical protein